MFSSVNRAAYQNATFLSVGKGDHPVFQMAHEVNSRNSIYTWIGTRAGTFNDLTRDFHAPARSRATFFSQASDCVFQNDEFNFIDLTLPEEAYLMSPPYFSAFEGCRNIRFKNVNMNLYNGPDGGSFNVHLNTVTIENGKFDEIDQWPQHSTDEEQGE